VIAHFQAERLLSKLTVGCFVLKTNRETHEMNVERSVELELKLRRESQR
jgi:hypothetical protein